MKKILIACVGLVLLGAGCGARADVPAADEALPSDPPAIRLPELEEESATIIHTREYMGGYGTSSTLYAVELENNAYAAAVEYSAHAKLLSAWGKPSDIVVLNAGYFHEDYSPSGFVMIDGERVGSRMFDQDTSGLLVIRDGRVSLRDLDTQPIADDEQFEFAVQSYPWLIRNGEPAIAQDSGQLSRRTAIGLNAFGTAYLIIADQYDISLYQLAQELARLDIEWASVLNLDGGSSTGLIMNEGERQVRINSQVPVPMVLRFIRQR